MTIPGIRATVAMAIVNGAAHFVALLFALALFALGVFILVSNVKALTVTLLIAALGCITVAMALAIPSQAKLALTFVVQAKDSLIGGKRWSDPSGPPQ